MTFDDCVRLIQEKYPCTENDAIEVVNVYEYKQAMERGKDKCMIEEKTIQRKSGANYRNNTV